MDTHQTKSSNFLQFGANGGPRDVGTKEVRGEISFV